MRGLALTQAETAKEAARRAAQPAKPAFALGFVTGKEINWLPEAMRILHDELPNIEVTVSSQNSLDLADGLSGAGSTPRSCGRKSGWMSWLTGV
jgi:LysR family transcriptional regulator, hca operon transcriptional activator